MVESLRFGSEKMALSLAGQPLISSVDAAICRPLREQTEMALATLAPREQAVLRVRFGIGGIGEHTRDEVSRLLALPRERIDQIVAQALRKIRHPARTVNLGSVRRL